LQESRKAVADNGEDDPSHVTLCLDGSWQKCYHTFLIDILSATFFNEEEVLGTEIMGKLCFVCHSNPASEQKCAKNYEGTGFGMQVTAVLSIFSRSLHTQGIYYTNYLGNGTAKVTKRVFAEKPSSPNISAKGLECIVHVQKRMVTSLRRYIKEKIRTKLHDGKQIGSRCCSFRLKYTNYKILWLSHYGLMLRFWKF
jgi:hypothetical protein